MNPMRKESEELTDKLRELVREKGNSISVSDIATAWGKSEYDASPLIERLNDLGYIIYENNIIEFLPRFY